MKTTVSCIIPTLNEKKNIQYLIRSINKQILSNFIVKEIIVVDNGSTDNTTVLASQLNAIVFTKPNLSIGGLRNFGAQKAIGDILFFLDADNILTENVIDKVVKNLNKENVGAQGIPLRPYGKGTWVERTWYYHIHTINKTVHEVQTLASGAFGIKKKIFFEAGGFDERLTVGEDTELAHKLREHNYKIILDPQCIVYNKGFPKNILEFIKSEIWHGDSFKSVFFHKKIDILTIYFVLSFFSIILFLFSMVGIVNRINAVLPVILIFIPAIIKAFKKRKSFDLRFFQLLVIYTVYIVSRSLSIFKW